MTEMIICDPSTHDIDAVEVVVVLVIMAGPRTGFVNLLENSILELSAVITSKAKVTNTETAVSRSIKVCAMLPVTPCAYSVEASASTVNGNEYAHHAMLNFLIDFLNRAGLQTCYFSPF